MKLSDIIMLAITSLKQNENVHMQLFVKTLIYKQVYSWLHTSELLHP